MGLKIKGLKKLRASLERQEQKTSKASLRFMRRAGREIAKEAAARAPVDTGDLESAISSRDAKRTDGRGRVTVEVYIDQDKLNLEEHNDYDYSVKMHEGSYNLGLKSLIKAASSPYEIGPKFLSRAIEDNRDRLLKEAAEVVKRSLEK